MKFLKIGMMIFIIGVLCGCSVKTTTRVSQKEVLSQAEICTSSILNVESSTTSTQTKAVESLDISSVSTTTSVIENSLNPTEEIKTTTEYLIIIRPANAETHTKVTTSTYSNKTEENEKNETICTATSVYVVYKPNTHYIHNSNCWWVDFSCYKIESTNDLECRKCSECNPELEIINEYVVPQSDSISKSTVYVKNFSRGTYYAYGGARNGGSGRNLIDCSYGDDIVKGSIASSYLYNNYGYNYNGKRTMLYLEISDYSEMNGYYYLDDSDAGNPEVIDFFYLCNSNCQFQNQGVVSVDCYIVNY